MKVIKTSAALSLAVLLVACGGGGGGGGGGFGFAGVAATASTETPAAATTTTTTTASAPAPVTTTDPAIPNNVLDSAGQFDAAAYRSTAAMMGKDGGIAYRYGPSPADYGNADKLDNLPTWGQRPDTAFVSNQNGGDRPCNPETCGTWQVGTWSNDIGGYSSNMGQVAYIPDSPSQRIGVSGLAISSVGNAVFSQKPELSWTYYGLGLDEMSAMDYKAAGGDASNPVAVGRCYGRGWCLNSIMVFQNGLIGTAQSNTSRNKASAQLAPGKVPTAIAVSNSNEFAFITVWDTVNLRGEIAVVALAGLCDGCSTGNPGGWYNYWGEWKGVYPGLPNLGNIAAMKVLGYMPLPADMKAPTEISVTTGLDPNAYLAAGTPGYDSPYGLSPLSNSNNRNRFKAGGSAYNSYAKAGVAVVVSKSEQKVAFVDLKPLFQYYQSMYFGSDANYDLTTDLGPGDGQWPRTFAAASQQTPTLIKTVSLPSRPTAVKAYAWGNKRAWVATQDGKLRIFNLGDYPTAGAGSAASITEGASVEVGVNPTGITYPKEKAGSAVYPDIAKELIVTSRGMRQVTWVRFAGDGNSGSVVRTLNDTRLKDPISAEDTYNHSTESYVVSVADYGGRALRNYRYGPIIMHNYAGQTYGLLGSPVANLGHFEYGGAFDLPGKAFQVVSSNVP